MPGTTNFTKLTMARFVDIKPLAGVLVFSLDIYHSHGSLEERHVKLL